MPIICNLQFFYHRFIDKKSRGRYTFTVNKGVHPKATAECCAGLGVDAFVIFDRLPLAKAQGGKAEKSVCRKQRPAEEMPGDEEPQKNGGAMRGRKG